MIRLEPWAQAGARRRHRARQRRAGRARARVQARATQKEGTRVAGVRTFSLLGLGAGLAGLIGAQGQPFAAGAIVLAHAGVSRHRLCAQAQGARATRPARSPPRRRSPSAFLGGIGQRRPGARRRGDHRADPRAEGRGARLRRPARRRGRQGARPVRGDRAGRPAVPAEPGDGPYGAWNPPKLWWVVVLVTGFSFAGYVANRIFGARHGTIATAVIGGAYSSTAVTQSLAQRLGSGEGGGAEPAGIALASAVMYLRVLVLVAILATADARAVRAGHRAGAGRRRAGGLVALSQGAAAAKGRPARQSDRAGAGARLPAVRRRRGGRRALGGGAVRPAGHRACCC